MLMVVSETFQYLFIDLFSKIIYSIYLVLNKEANIYENNFDNCLMNVNFFLDKKKIVELYT